MNKKKDIDFDVEIGLDSPIGWTDEKMAKVEAFIKQQSAKQTPERKLRNEILSIKYKNESL